MDLHPELLVVGAGPAGLSAASEATRAGVRTLVLDAGESTGGQFYARPPGGAWDEGVPQALVTGARLELLDVRLRTAVWGAFGDSVAVVREGHSSLVRPGSIVLATGATERVVPFPGWDQPGVVAPGGLQRLLKVARVVPNGAVVLAGSGPFLLAVAADLRRAGADVRAVVEARSRYELAGLLRGLARNPERRREAIGFARALRGVELRFGVSVRGAEEGSVRLSDGTRIPADVLCVGYGFRPGSSWRACSASPRPRPECASTPRSRPADLACLPPGRRPEWGARHSPRLKDAWPVSPPPRTWASPAEPTCSITVTYTRSGTGMRGSPDGSKPSIGQFRCSPPPIQGRRSAAASTSRLPISGGRAGSRSPPTICAPSRPSFAVGWGPARGRSARRRWRPRAASAGISKGARRRMRGRRRRRCQSLRSLGGPCSTGKWHATDVACPSARDSSGASSAHRPCRRGQRS